ncbi:hypothetical protein WG954_15945 [Lacibacter sp. H375]|uniref:hypothetical protein n=1 Tax=Lacibacter sp. H375 TaxID=3133424 RepID=UPI0030BF6198
MKLSEFILLGEAEKQHTVLHRGVLVAKRTEETSLVFLFQLGAYYVETWCNVANRSVTEYRMFENTAPLEPYLEEISLQHLLN